MHAFAAGARVAHSQYGDGTVIRVDHYHTRIQFDGHGLHTFVSGRVVLAGTDTLAPPKARRQSRKVAAR